MIKKAIDQAAKDYWKLLYGEYGEALVRDIPRRIKAALYNLKKVASINESAELLPLAHAKDDNFWYVEGMYKDGSAKLLFKASIDSNGDVTEVKTVEIR